MWRLKPTAAGNGQAGVSVSMTDSIACFAEQGRWVAAGSVPTAPVALHCGSMSIRACGSDSASAAGKVSPTSWFLRRPLSD